MLPKFCHKHYTEDAKELVHKIRQRLEAEFGQLPDLSPVSLNRGCCLQEAPRVQGARQKKCSNCLAAFDHWRHFKLSERGNPLGSITCNDCNAANPPPGHKWCTTCRNYHPLALFEGLLTCGPCLERSRRNAHKRAFVREGHEDEEYDPDSYDVRTSKNHKPFTEAEEKILRDGHANGLTLTK